MTITTRLRAISKQGFTLMPLPVQIDPAVLAIRASRDGPRASTRLSLDETARFTKIDFNRN